MTSTIFGPHLWEVRPPKAGTCPACRIVSDNIPPSHDGWWICRPCLDAKTLAAWREATP